MKLAASRQNRPLRRCLVLFSTVAFSEVGGLLRVAYGGAGRAATWDAPKGLYCPSGLQEREPVDVRTRPFRSASPWRPANVAGISAVSFWTATVFTLVAVFFGVRDGQKPLPVRLMPFGWKAEGRRKGVAGLSARLRP